MTEPHADRPVMPGYGVPETTEGILPWEWAEERITASHNIYLATTHPDGRPHIMPIWGVWAEGAFFFSTAADSRKAKNLAANPNCAIATEDASEAVIVEGLAALETDPATLAEFTRAYKEKYDWDIDATAGGIYRVQPKKAFGFQEAADDFAETSTRWVWD